MMKTLYAISAISLMIAVSLPVVAESIEKGTSSSETMLYTKLLSMGLEQQPSMQHGQECVLHLQENQQWLVKTDDLLLGERFEFLQRH